jgi:hypothetical protein
VEADKLTLEPWPFEPTSFRVNFESRLLDQLQFKDAAEFREAFHKAKLGKQYGNFVKSEIPVKTTKV